MLELKDINIKVENKQILNNISIKFDLGKNYCILGTNGSWKSSLAMTIMWNPKYEINSWDIVLWNKSIKNLKPNERSNLWIFLAFQNIPEIPWLKLFEFLRTIYNSKNKSQTSFLQFKKIIDPLFEELNLDREFLRRDLNVGFSWWERRKIEILQIKLLKPKYIILDEIDSWLDVDSFKSVANLISKQNTQENTFIIITHIFNILDYIPIENTIILKEWKISKKWWPELVDIIKKKWFN